jgi:hypothetical protein
MNKLEKIVIDYIEKYNKKREWQWRTIKKNECPAYLFINNRHAAITVYEKVPVGYDTFKFHRFGKNFAIVADNFSRDMFGIFGEENLEFCNSIFVKWIYEKLPLRLKYVKKIGEK